jgi:Ca-activated chloride channel family protein
VESSRSALEIIMRRLSYSFAVLVAGLTGTSGGLAQAQFQSRVDLVALDVCVKQHNGSPETALKPGDFLVLEDGVPQKISLFSAEGHVPLAVSILVDSSESMSGPPLERARAAAGALIDLLRPDDLVEVMSFSDRASLRYPLGADHGRAKSVLTDISAGGATALYEAVLVAVHNQEHAQHKRTADYREVMVLLSDGDNTAGRVTFDNVLERVRHSGVLVYTVSLITDARNAIVAPSWEMAQLAFDTGGQAVASRDAGSLTRIYQDIAEELLHLYRLGYVPSPPAHEGGWRRIMVRVPERGVVVRARSGYYAPDASASESSPTKTRGW